MTAADASLQGKGQSCDVAWQLWASLLDEKGPSESGEGRGGKGKVEEGREGRGKEEREERKWQRQGKAGEGKCQNHGTWATEGPQSLCCLPVLVSRGSGTP